MEEVPIELIGVGEVDLAIIEGEVECTDLFPFCLDGEVDLEGVRLVIVLEEDDEEDIDLMGDSARFGIEDEDEEIAETPKDEAAKTEALGDEFTDDEEIFLWMSNTLWALPLSDMNFNPFLTEDVLESDFWGKLESEISFVDSHEDWLVLVIMLLSLMLLIWDCIFTREISDWDLERVCVFLVFIDSSSFTLSLLLDGGSLSLILLLWLISKFLRFGFDTLLWDLFIKL